VLERRDRCRTGPGTRLGAMVGNRVDITKMGIAIWAGEVFYREDGGLGCGLRIRSALADFLPVELAKLGECVLNQRSAKDSGDFHLERINKKRIDLSHRLRTIPRAEERPREMDARELRLSNSENRSKIC